MHSVRRFARLSPHDQALLKFGLVLMTIYLAVACLYFDIRSILPPYVYGKDTTQEYLLARASRIGVDPYQPLPDLGRRLISSSITLSLAHPTPHPPPVAVLALPLAWLSYEQAAIAWFLVQLLCLGAAVWLTVRTLWPRLAMPWVRLIIVLSFIWPPVQDDLLFGQINTLLLLLIVLTWRAVRMHRWRASAVYCSV